MDAYRMAIRIEESPTRAILPELEPVKSRPKQKMWHKLHKLFGRDGSASLSPAPSLGPSPGPRPADTSYSQNQQLATRRDFNRKVGVGLPRPGTFRRQNSERRQRLEPIHPCASERRAVSAQRQQRAASAYRPRSRSSPSPQLPCQASAPSLSLRNGASNHLGSGDHTSPRRKSTEPTDLGDHVSDRSTSPYRAPSQCSSERFDEIARDEKILIDMELDTKWILNLSMHFRDRSEREKFFVTFAELPNRWRRVTISCDYRNAEPDSLETDLKELQYQRDKNAQIYESIRDSLPSIQFYNTVTNLKLQTENGRLHVHVTEDVNEIIPYPPRLSVQHILGSHPHPIREARECEISFLSHLSGFVYKVGFCGREYIKKEIPGPDTVDEFLYEVNALHALSGSTSVIKLEAIVFDDIRQKVKGLLISYAERGALVDLLYDNKGRIPWPERMRWARQAVQGLSEIHEEGYVQGDFTLSNIVINGDGDAKIIDINRRGCPVGWEPPEIADKITSGQRISMYISHKSDLFQLGMTLWALAMDEDEPERHDQPLSMDRMSEEVPGWFKEIVTICLDPQPRARLSAKELLRLFPPLPREYTTHQTSTMGEVVDDRSPKKYIEPHAAVEREDLERLGRPRRRSNSPGPSTEDASLVHPPSSYNYDSGSSFVGVRKVQGPPLHSEKDDEHESGHETPGDNEANGWDERKMAPRIISISPGRVPRYEGFGVDMDTDQQPQSSALPEAEATENHSFKQSTSSDGNIMSSHSVSETWRESGSKGLDDDLELPGPYQPITETGTTSITSNSTPRNATSVLATSAMTIASSPALALAMEDFAGLGGHPNLDEHSPHEPIKAQTDMQASQYYDAQPQPQPQPQPSDSPIPSIATALPRSSDSTKAPSENGGSKTSDPVGEVLKSATPEIGCWTVQGEDKPISAVASECLSEPKSSFSSAVVAQSSAMVEPASGTANTSTTITPYVSDTSPPSTPSPAFSGKNLHPTAASSEQPSSSEDQPTPAVSSKALDISATPCETAATSIPETSLLEAPPSVSLPLSSPASEENQPLLIARDTT